MGKVLELRTRQVASGEWSPSELGQLYALFDRMPRDPGREIAFGVTDAGDPWVAVMNGDEEVVLHVARIGGRIIVHAAGADFVTEAPNLTAAATRLAGVAGLERRPSNVSSLYGETLPPHALAALSSVASPPASADAPLGATQGLARFAPAAAESAVILAFAPIEAQAAGEPEAAAPAVVPIAPESAPAPISADAPSAPAVAAAPAPAPAAPTLHAAQGEAVAAVASAAPALGGETLIGGAGADTLVGGAGEDVLDGGGAPGDRIDLLDGGAGDDRLVLRPQTVAIGGSGNDAFAVTPGSAPHGPAHNLGVVMDFFGSREDRLEFGAGSQVTIVGISNESDILAGARTGGGLREAPLAPGARVMLDLNGDGKADGFVLLGNFRGDGARGGQPGDHADLLALLRGGPADTTSSRAPGPADPDMQALFNSSVIGTAATPHGTNSVLTAFQIGPNLFGERPAAAAAEFDPRGLLRPDDLAAPDLQLFG